MARPLPLELPLLQNWSCHTCGGCCKQHGIYVTDEERRRIEQQNWTAADGVGADQPLFVQMGGGVSRSWQRLAHRADGSCVFLDERGLCRIHGKFGEPAKPLACRIYPYAFHPTAKGLTLSLRFSCPSVVENLGTPVAEQRQELQRLARMVAPQELPEVPAPKLIGGRSIPWSDVLQTVDALDATFAQPDVSVGVKLLQCLNWLQQLEHARLDHIQGPRYAELLQLLLDGAALEVKALPVVPRQPARIAATQFRLLVGQYARKDTYSNVQPTWLDRWKLLRWGWRFAWGGGDVPAVQDVFREVPFSHLEAPFGELPPDTDEFLTRYFRVKVQGLHFCGAAFYHESVIHGFYSLALVYPVVLWIARWLAASVGRTRLERSDVLQAITIADHHHGYSPALGTWSFRSRVRTLAQMNEIATLIAWYSR